MHRACLLLLAALTAFSAAEGTTDTERLKAAIAALDATPVALAYRELSAKIDALSEGIAPQVKQLRGEQRLIEAQQDFRDYIQQREALAAQLLHGWDAERKAMQAAAQRIYGARHAELRARAPAAIPQGLALGFDVLSYPRIDGSTSTSPLGVVMACRLLDVPYAWQYPPMRGSPLRRRGDLERFELDMHAFARDDAAQPAAGPRDQQPAGQAQFDPRRLGRPD
jgi:hypothetical protein